MSNWTDRIKSHSIWQQLETLGPATDQALSREGVIPNTFEGLNRIKAVVAFTGKRLSAADSMLILPSILDNLSNSIQVTTAEVQQYVANGNDGHIINANTHIDNALSYLAQIIVPSSTKELAGIREGTDAFRLALESNLVKAHGVLTTFQSDLASLQERLTALTSEVTAERQRLSSLASEHQSQFSNSQELRNTENLAALTARQEKFAALMLDYTQKLNEQSADFTHQQKQIEQSQKDDLTAMSSAYKDQAKQILEETQQHLKQVEKLVGVIGNLGVTSGYQQTANEARTTARVWQGIAVASLVGIIIFACLAFLPVIKGAFSWSSFAGRVFVSISVGVLAAYAITQADRYQQVERRSRKLALELEALGPFVASLAADKQDEFRYKVGERSFGTSADLIDGHSVDSPKSVVDVAMKSKDLISLLEGVIKAVRG